MHYALTIAVFSFFAVPVIFYGVISTRKKALVFAYEHLKNCIHAQTKIVASFNACIGNAQSAYTTQTFTTMLRRIEAIETLGMHAVDQHADAYTSLYQLVQVYINVQHRTEHLQLDKNVSDFEHSHVQQQHAQVLYNRAAFAYNNCQRNDLQNWLACHFGHTMAPPC